jgi:NAD(P)-dependent dehydrogenase (short-subunit alcohol dehydrogenase family)
VRGKVVLVSGSTDGIGKQAALELARRGARVFVHGRDPDKGRAVADELRRASGNPRIELLLADFASFDQVRALAKELRKETDRLDVLVNNAGLYAPERELTVDGLELTFQVNYLSHFLLTELLLDLIVASAPARVICVSSTLHRHAHLDFDNLQGERRYDGDEAYAVSKLAMALFARELARRLFGTGVTANAVHPGGADTKLLRGRYGPGGGPPELAARSIVYLATSDEAARVTGAYFDRTGWRAPSPEALDDELARRLWELSERLTSLR